MKKKESIFTGMGIPFLLVIIIWSVHFLNLSFPELKFYTYGIFPRTLSGLKGVIFSPFLHNTSDYSHIINNSVPLFVLSYFLYISYNKIFTRVTLFIWLFSGLWTWLAARESFHIGASGVIYGLAFFLFFSGVFSKNKQLISVSLIVVFLYGSMVWGIFPGEEQISWEGHLFGAISGTIMAVYYRKRFKSTKKYNLTVNPEFEEFVDEYNYQLKLQQDAEEEIKKQTTDTTADEKMKIFFEYLKKE